MSGGDYLQHLRDQHNAQRAEQGLPPTPEPIPAGSVIATSSDGVRVTPGLADEHLTQAVLMAKAVVELDDRAWRTAAKLRRAEQRIAELERQGQAAGKRHEKTRRRLHAVQALHSEAQQVACADGCCHEGLGVCRCCGEAWPCRTYRVADGKTGADVDG